ncbi:MAG: beta-ketoacyl synthase N-terminal-like domain-containing protein [Alphaproteobacteria bacterium]
MRAVSIIGIGSTKFGRWKQRALEDLAVEAARQAIGEARVEPHQLGALYLGNFVGGVLTGQEVLAGLVGSALGMPNESPCTKVEGACASGGIAFRHAYLAVASGLCDYAIAVGAEKMAHATTAKVTEALNCAMDTRRDAPSGLSFPGMYGLAFRLYESQYGDMRRPASAVVMKNKKNGLKNPLAQMGEDVSAETVENSPLIADPIRLYDCSPISDGAAAVVVAASDLVRDRLSRGLALPIEVRAVAQTRGSADIAGLPTFAPSRPRAAPLRWPIARPAFSPASSISSSCTIVSRRPRSWMRRISASCRAARVVRGPSKAEPK